MELPSGVARWEVCRGAGASTAYRFVPPFPIPMPVRVECGSCGGSGLIFSWDEIEAEKEKLTKGEA